MPTAYDPITASDVDTASEAWRHSCECRWLLTNKPTRAEKHLHLYGVTDREKLFRNNSKTGQAELRSTQELRELWQDRKSIMSFRNLEAADRILEGAKIIYNHERGAAA